MAMVRRAVLVVGNAAMAESLARMLSEAGFEPFVAQPQTDPVDLVHAHHPHVVLLDREWKAGDRDALELCRTLKYQRETNLVPVILITNGDSSDDRLDGVRVGADAYLARPVRPEDLTRALDQATAWRREHERHGLAGEIRFRIRSEFEYLRQLNDMLADLFAHTRLTDKQIKELRQAVHEMGGNAIEWGHRRNADLPLAVTYRIYPDKVTLIVRDQGPGFDRNNLPHAASEDDPVAHMEYRMAHNMRDGGFGIMMARGLVDEFAYNEEGNEVTLVKRFPPAE
ncbi:response regulator receiver protein [Isosphaera pallida ATCC 43644]|uniref:Response regulator receiver protein n=1 Tax=Isosphaera pallida (strain ATCC 43644 / DSM 9630 / IS1B) TaxID=575540 RepID=E8R3Y1_ISOPI|nr:ATP-binding protein [Isosphaera pallida]ADV63711.1 response regulator receiver protein [Isosphaera pallida ATCC 43644]